MMERPIMNPTFLDDSHADAGAPQRWRALRVAARVIWRALGVIYRVLAYDPLRRRLRIEEGNTLWRFVRGITYRAAFLPLVLAGIVCLIVWQATHPRFDRPETNLSSVGLYYEPVILLTSDHIRLEAALFSVLDAKQVLQEKEKALRKRYPAVVLVHDFGMRRDQMLPLVRPLHDAGFVVLAVNLRGTGASGTSEAQTFGLRESRDIKSAVEMLRRRPSIDPDRITIVAAGTGATAALICANEDKTSLRALVLADPVLGVESLLDGKLAPRHPLLTWLKPLCKWTFEFAYQLDIDDVQWSQFKQVVETRPVLVLGMEGGQTDFSWWKNVDAIRAFLVEQTLDAKVPIVKADGDK